MNNYSKHHQPNFENFKRAIQTKTPGPVPVGDLFADLEVVGELLGEKGIDYYGEVMFEKNPSASDLERIADRYADQVIRFCVNAGWDFSYVFSIIPFEGINSLLAEEQLEHDNRKRGWTNDNEGPIQSWEDFQKYPWPRDVERINLAVRRMASRLPDGMQAMVIPGGIFEWTTQLMGFVPFSYALADQPDLVDAVIEKVAETIYLGVDDIIHEPGVGGVFMGDDWGYASGTMISTRTMRQKFVPQLKKIVDLAHQADKLFLLHSCGKMYQLMDELISIGVDGKHSYEDKIFPVELAYQQYADRIAILGGVDVHLLASGTEEQVRKRTRQILEACAPGGHYVLGTGNSVVNYMPMNNYLAMLDEGKRWNAENWV
jgi:uroporphyrinogen decarboxylase